MAFVEIGIEQRSCSIHLPSDMKHALYHTASLCIHNMPPNAMISHSSSPSIAVSLPYTPAHSFFFNSPLSSHPCRCLCFGFFEQIIYTYPFLLTLYIPHPKFSIELKLSLPTTEQA